MDDEAHSSDEMRPFKVAGRLINIAVDGGQEARRKELDLRNSVVTPGHVDHVLGRCCLTMTMTKITVFTRGLGGTSSRYAGTP